MSFYFLAHCVCRSLAPVSEPVNKISALQQAAGEVTYISDRPRLAGELEGAPVLSTEPNAFIECVPTACADVQMFQIGVRGRGRGRV